MNFVTIDQLLFVSVLKLPCYKCLKVMSVLSVHPNTNMQNLKILLLLYHNFTL